MCPDDDDFNCYADLEIEAEYEESILWAALEHQEWKHRQELLQLDESVR